MITKIEINGFKSFSDFEAEFNPLVVIAGANGSGKSNLFDAIRLLSRLAQTDLKSAFGSERGDVSELFTRYPDGQHARKMHFAVEMLVDREHKDDWGGHATLRYTRLRYELTIKTKTNRMGLQDLEVEHERLERIAPNTDRWLKKIPQKYHEQWRPKVKTGRRTKPYIYTSVENEQITIHLPQDGRRGGKESPANVIAQTVLSGINNVDFPHVFAAKNEMISWKFLQLNPLELRKPSQKFTAKEYMGTDGSDLPASLYRMKLDNPAYIKDVSRSIQNLLPIIKFLDVEEEKTTNQYVLKAITDDGRAFSSQVLSEGTLRLIALSTLQHDIQHKGVLCFEEPENGIHPYRLGYMTELLSNLSTDLFSSDESHLPIRQIIVNTHSPALLNQIFKLSKPEKLTVLYCSLATQIDPKAKTKSRHTIMRNVTYNSQRKIWDSTDDASIALAEVINYLESTDSEDSISNLRSKITNR